MDRLIDGDFIFVILGEKYLRSEYCMYELYHIWQRTQRDPERFRGRVIPMLLDGTAIGALEDRIVHAAHWKARHETYQRLIQADSTLIAPEDFARSKHVAEYYLHVASILYLLNDRLIPRDLARLEATAYAEVINLIRPPT
ncbi:MAG: toll/interleukin-1 receptor domain-containing protein [Myxococcales bacterium]|nr:toll/interleukin-1 receptor domain-containing protein [Myxococcales bacterium]